MKTLNTLRTATLATMAVAAVSLPTLAQANEYNRHYDASAECKSQENDARLVGGLLGAVVGGVVGSQVSGNGARTEGSAIGAVVGGLAGAGIGDESVDCDRNRRDQYRNGRYTNGVSYGTRSPVVYRGNDNYRTVGYRDNRNYRNDRNYRNNGHRVSDTRQIRKELHRIDRRQYEVECDLKDLHSQKRYMSRSQFKRLRSNLYAELEQLNRREDRLKSRLRYASNQYYR